MEQVTFVPTFTGWQRAARRALARGLAPERVAWEELGSDQPSLGMFDESVDDAGIDVSAFRVPRAFVLLAESVACHREAPRWGLLYRVLWRLTHGEPRLLDIVVDPDVDALGRMEKAVRREVHKMRAFVRFRSVAHEGEEWHVAWFEPEHHVVERNAPFFRDRFAGMHWSILTPDRCVHWDGQHLSFTAGVPRSEAPDADAMEGLWRTYYGNIFNPARVKTRAMQKEMPKRYWKNLPETAIIPALLERAPVRVEQMIAASDARIVQPDEWDIARPPADADWEALHSAALGCRACPLWRDATQTVFGEGPRPAELMLLGEQPGDQEDREGHAFVGPAGKLLDAALAEAGIANIPTKRASSAVCEPVLEAEVRHVLDEEFATTVDDVARRTRLGLGACGGMRCALRCGQIVAQDTGISQREGRHQALRFLTRQRILRAPALGPDQARQEPSPSPTSRPKSARKTSSREHAGERESGETLGPHHAGRASTGYTWGP